MTGKKRSRKSTRWGRIVEVLNPIMLPEGGALRLYECPDLPKRKGDSPYQVEHRKNGKNTYLVNHPGYYNRSRIERLYLSINSWENFEAQSKELNSEYVPEVKVKASEEESDTRNLNMEKIVDSESKGEGFGPEDTIFAYELEEAVVGQESEEYGIGEAFAYAEKMFSMD